MNVSEQQRVGEATGASIDSDRLLREAIAKALGQDPPTVDGADILVGRNVFVVQKGSSVTVTVTGYPAWYTNFRSNKDVSQNEWLIVPGSATQGLIGQELRFTQPHVRAVLESKTTNQLDPGMSPKKREGGGLLREFFGIR